MRFNPEKCAIPDKRMQPFIDSNEIWNYINNTTVSDERVQQIINKSLNKERLTLEETAVLVNANTPEQVEMIKNGARTLSLREPHCSFCTTLHWQ